jgi:hypothetical protein
MKVVGDENLQKVESGKSEKFEVLQKYKLSRLGLKMGGRV